MAHQSASLTRSLASLLSLVLLAPSPASAQPSQGAAAGDDLEARAASVRSVGMAAVQTIWDSQEVTSRYGDFPGAQLATREGAARVALDSLLLYGAYTGLFQWLPGIGDPDDQVLVLRTGTPEIGASFRDRPASGWRYEIGGAVAFPATSESWLDGLEGPSSLPLENFTSHRSLGWNAYRLLDETVTLVAKVRGEWDALPELVLALEVDVPVQISFDGDVAVQPQVALDVAGRFLAHQMVGLRAELTTSGRHGDGVNVLLEPFARFVVLDRVAAPFLRLALRLPLGPTLPLRGVAEVGYLGGSVTIGALY